MKGWVEGHPYIFSVDSSVSISHQPLIQCSVSGVPIRALIDTGSMKSFISADIFKKISPRPVLEHNAPQCISITGQQMFVEGTTQLELLFQGASMSASYECQFIVSSSLTASLECVLGWDFLTGNGLSLSVNSNGAYHLVGPHGSAPLQPYRVEPNIRGVDFKAQHEKPISTLLVQSTVRSQVPVSLKSTVCIPGRSEVLVCCQLPKNSSNQLGMVSPLDCNDSLPSCIISAYIVCQSQGREIYSRLMNTSNTDIELQGGQKISQFCPLVETDTPAPSSSLQNLSFVCSSRTSEIAQQLEGAISSSLNEGEKHAVLETLLEFSDVFEETLGHSDVVTHKIDTGDSAPIRQYPRRLPYAYRHETQSQIKEMLDQNIIQPSSSPWASPVVLVKKKDGKFRFCVDYRKLNSVTKKDAHPLPRMDDLIDALQGSKYFSTLDLRSGYWQLSVEPKDREKTAFVTPDGLWEFLRLPFGVTGGPTTFQRAIEIVLSGLTYDTCLCYFDDIIIPSRSIDEQCDRLTRVLSRFRAHNLRVKASKCKFASDQVLFLGHIVSSQGVHTDPAKIQAVSLIPEPLNVEHVRSFLGLAGYYRRFIPNFATIAAPLVALTKKATKFTWQDSQRHAFQTLKASLCNAPILAYPQLDQPFIVQTDASDLGLGAVLTQRDKSGNERVISYASRALSEREKAFSATEKEALAVVFALEQFRVYLLGVHFLLVTDHSALQWLHSIEPKGRIARWVMQLQEYSFTVRHKPGKLHSNADSLSRLPSPIKDSLPLEPENFSFPSCVTTISPTNSLFAAQRADPDLHKVIEMKFHGFPRPPAFVWKDNEALRSLWHCWDELYLQDGLLVKKLSKTASFPLYAFVIPPALVPSVLRGIHASPFSGHLGITKTLLRARNRFFWPKMSVDIRKFVAACETCAQIKLNSCHNKAPLQPIEVNEPFVFWAMDYMGPLPETTNGNRHLLVVMDHFTKWCEVFPTKDQKAKTVADLLVSRVFSRFGPPVLLHSDQGRNFESNLMHEICQLMGTHKSRTTAYHPQCDGLVERQNRTLQEMLAAYVADYPHDWDNWVSLAVYAYNTSSHSSTGFSPYEMVFGRMPRTPLELDLDLPLHNPSSQSEYTQSVRRCLHNIKNQANKNLQSQRQQQSNYYNRSCPDEWSPFAIGSSVWVRRPKSWKFGKKWIGPFEILSRKGVTYHVRSKEGKSMVVHHDNLKQSVVPANKGVAYCPVPDSSDITFVEEPAAPRGQQFRRPARLRQNINPPLRFGEYVTH